MISRSSPQQQQKYGNGVHVCSMVRYFGRQRDCPCCSVCKMSECHRLTNVRCFCFFLQRCVLCGAPFRNPTNFDRVTACLAAPSSSFRWLTQWYSLPAPSDHQRKRGEPPAFFCHKDCCTLMYYKLNMQPQHELIWPHVRQQMSAADSIPDSLAPASYLGVAEMLDVANSRSPTMLSAAFTPDDSWMLHSPLVCTKNASRILTIWQPKLDMRPPSLVQRLSNLLLSPTKSFRVRPVTRSGPDEKQSLCACSSLSEQEQRCQRQTIMCAEHLLLHQPMRS